MGEHRGSRVARIELHALADHAEGGEEQADAHHAGGQDAGHGGAGHHADVLDAGDAGLHQAMAAGEGDVAADGAAHQGDDRQHQDQRIVRGEGMAERRGQRRIGRVHGIADHDQHQQAEQLGHRVHHPAGVAHQEDGDGRHCGDQRADQRRHAEDHVERQAGPGDVADVEGDAAEDDEAG
ncbi:hypothetical protein D9M71_530570 [compost metagenome]